MKVSLQKVVNVYVTITAIGKDKSSPKWAYGLAKNKAIIQKDIDGVIAAEKQIEDAQNERIKYCESIAEKDKNGKPLTEKNARGQDVYKGISETDPIIIEHVEKIKKLNEEYKELLKTEVDIEFYKIDFEEVPGQIAPLDFENLSVMIKVPK